jgi:Icc-related predicted phosphoesterase
MKKIWHFSDTHTFHKLLTVPENIDIAIFSGDCSNPLDLEISRQQILEFLDWFSLILVGWKIFVPGNHDTAIAKGWITKKDFEDRGIIYLENDYVTINNMKIFGSPYTPTFGNWSFMKARDKMDKLWSKVDDDVDVFVVHGPPKGILDLSYDRNHKLENCGCNALKRHVLHRIKPKFCLFGHIHNVDDIINAGVLKLSDYPTVFSNGSVVTDGKFGKLSSNGNILIYE